VRTLSPAALASAFAESTGEVWLLLCTIEHPDIEGDALRFVNNMESVTSRGELYIAFPFTVELPGEDAENLGEARLRIDNIDRMIVEVIRTISSPPTVTLEVVLASSPDAVEASFEGMTLRAVSYDAQAVSGVLKFEDIAGEPMSLQMTPQRFPGMF
jgi:hypothetical protein